MGNNQPSIQAEKKHKKITNVNHGNHCPIEEKEEFDVSSRPTVTEDHKVVIIKTWKILQADIAKVGVCMFIG